MNILLNFNDPFSYHLTPKGYLAYCNRMKEFNLPPETVFFQQPQKQGLAHIIFDFGKAIIEDSHDLFVDNLFYDENNNPFDFLNSSCDIIWGKDAYKILKISPNTQKAHLSFQKLCFLFYNQFFMGNPHHLIENFSATFHLPNFQLINSFQKPIIHHESKKKLKA
jgi:hypothetical protein